jgi:hypothetical protein
MPYKDPQKQREAVRRSREREQQLAVVESEDLPEPLNRDEVLRLLSREAKKGHVGAMRLLLREQLRDACRLPLSVPPP